MSEPVRFDDFVRRKARRPTALTGGDSEAGLGPFPDELVARKISTMVRIRTSLGTLDELESRVINSTVVISLASVKLFRSRIGLATGC